MKRRNHRDLAAGRLAKMRDALRTRRIMSVADFSRALSVSPATVRRDLLSLEQSGTLQRVHGGAVYREAALDEPVFDDKTARAVAEKRRIAEAAARLINVGDSIFLDGGSTVLELAKRLRMRNDLTIVTNSLRVAIELAGGGPRLILAGGELRRLSQTLVGPLSRHLLEQLQADIAFVGTIGLSPDHGLTTTDPDEAFTKNLLIERARRVILLADSTKVGRVSFARFGERRRPDILITDRGIAPAAAKAFRKAGMKITTV